MYGPPCGLPTGYSFRMRFLSECAPHPNMCIVRTRRCKFCANSLRTAYFPDAWGLSITCNGGYWSITHISKLAGISAPSPASRRAQAPPSNLSRRCGHGILSLAEIVLLVGCELWNSEGGQSHDGELLFTCPMARLGGCATKLSLEHLIPSWS